MNANAIKVSFIAVGGCLALGFLIAGFIRNCTGADWQTARLKTIEQRRKEIAELEPPPLVPFSKNSPRFAAELTFAPFISCPTPGVIEQPQYFARAGYDSLQNPINWLIWRFSDRPFRKRKMWQPEQQIRFKSTLRSEQIYREIEAHFRQYGYVFRVNEERPYAPSIELLDRTGVRINPPIRVIRSAYFAKPNPRDYMGAPYTSAPLSTEFRPHYVGVQMFENVKPLGFSTPLLFQHTEVEIRASERRFWVPGG